MRKLFLILFLFPLWLCAQELDALQTDSSIVDSLEIVPPKHVVGAYLIADVMFSPNPDGIQPTRSVGFGFKYDRVEGGVVFLNLSAPIERRLIFPNFFQLDYSSGGVFISYTIIPQDNYQLDVLGMYQHGDMVWQMVGVDEPMFRETFNIWRFGGSFELAHLTYVRPSVQFGYQAVSDILISGLSKQDFAGFYFGISIKIGFFNR